MAIGLVTDEELQAELESLRPKSRKKQDLPSKGRGPETPNVPDSLRKIIGEEAVLNGRQAALQIAKDFGVSSSSVSAYTHSATSTATYDTPSRSILSHINKSRVRASKRAGKVLQSALSAISQEKLDYTDAKDLSVIARNMSAIIKDLEPQQPPQEAGGPSQPQFVIFAPSFRKEESFEVIDVKE